MPLFHNRYEVMTMPEHLRALREDRDLTQKDMAKLLNIHQTTYSDYELGRLNIPIPILKQLAGFFGTSIGYLLDFTDISEPYPKKDEITRAAGEPIPQRPCLHSSF